MAGLCSCIGTDFVEEEERPERISIQQSKTNIEKGDTVTFQGTYYNEYGYQVEANFDWKSANDSIFRFLSDGLGEALDTGNVEIEATSKGIREAKTLTIYAEGEAPANLQSRKGTFKDADDGYFAEGTAKLTQNQEGGITLEFLEDFRTSNGPSVYVFLANETAGPFNYEEGGHVVNSTSAQITSNKLDNFSGAMTFEVPDEVAIDDYDYVVLYCILGPVFGYADLN